MRLCVNHPDRNSVYVCRNCRDEFCEECIEEGILNCYCKKPECQLALQREISSCLPENVTCPNCESLLILSLDERSEKRLTCSTCKAVLDFNYDPPDITHNLFSREYNGFEKPKLFSLFISPRDFFNKKTIYGKANYLLIIAYLFGFISVIDRFESKSFRRIEIDTAHNVMESWPAFWGFGILYALFSGLIIYGVGGWWYRKRLQLSGVHNPDKLTARYVYLYSNLVYIVPALLVFILYTALYRNYAEAVILDNTFVWIFFIFFFISLYTSYAGATEVFNPKRWKAVLWFIVLPAISFLLIFGTGLILKNVEYNNNYDNYLSKKPVPEGRIIIASDSTCQVKLPDNWYILKDLNDEAVIQAGNLYEEAYCMIISEYKDFVYMDFNEYFDFCTSNLLSVSGSYSKETIGNKYIYNTKSITVYTPDKIVYLLDVVETEEYFYQVLFWTLIEYEQEHIPVFQQVSESFREIIKPKEIIDKGYRASLY